jgi:hypothetical protein
MKQQRLKRKSDSLTFEGRIEFVEYDENDRGVKLHKTPAINYSIIVNPYLAANYDWLTSPITEIKEVYKEDVLTGYILKTKNSTYTLEEI